MEEPPPPFLCLHFAGEDGHHAVRWQPPLSRFPLLFLSSPSFSPSRLLHSPAGRRQLRQQLQPVTATAIAGEARNSSDQAPPVSSQQTSTTSSSRTATPAAGSTPTGINSSSSESSSASSDDNNSNSGEVSSRS